MRLKKGKIEGKFKLAFHELLSVEIKSKGHNYCLQRLRVNEIYDLIKVDPMKFGEPQFIAHSHDRYIIYPIPNKSYYMHVLGTVVYKL